VEDDIGRVGATIVSSAGPAIIVSWPEPAYIVSPNGGSPLVAKVYRKSSYAPVSSLIGSPGWSSLGDGVTST
jgi:hypothetical protein